MAIFKEMAKESPYSDNACEKVKGAKRGSRGFPRWSATTSGRAHERDEVPFMNLFLLTRIKVVHRTTDTDEVRHLLEVQADGAHLDGALLTDLFDDLLL